MKSCALCVYISLITVTCYTSQLAKQTFPDSVPLVSCDAFRNLCDFALDANESFEPEDVKTGDLVYVSGFERGDEIADLYDGLVFLKKFFTEFHPKIRHPYILVTHEGDWTAPSNFAKYLDDPKLYAWFARNLGCHETSKLHAIPIGISNERTGAPNQQHQEQLHAKLICEIQNEMQSSSQQERPYLLYGGFFSVYTNIKERIPVLSALARHSHFRFYESEITSKLYMQELSRSKFVTSPRGNGLDCYRTWEAMYLGCIPIILHSPLDLLYKDMPVLIISDWNELTKDFLEKRYRAIMSESHNLKKLSFDYWKDLILKKQANCRKQNAEREI